MSICIQTSKIRELIELTPSMTELCEHINTIECSENKPHIALDASKSLLESLSKTILADRKITPSRDDFHYIVRNAIESAETIKNIRDEESIIKLLQGFSTISLAIGTLRNKYGFYGHGRDTQSDKIHPLLADFVINCSLVVATFLLNLHDNERLIKPRLIYEDNVLFNEYFDRNSEEIKIGDIIISPSKAIFNEDEEAYRIFLKDFHSERENCILDLESSFTEQHLLDLCVYKGVLSTENLNHISEIINGNEDLFYSFSEETIFQIQELFMEDKTPLNNLPTIIFKKH